MRNLNPKYALECNEIILRESAKLIWDNKKSDLEWDDESIIGKTTYENIMHLIMSIQVSM